MNALTRCASMGRPLHSVLAILWASVNSAPGISPEDRVEAAATSPSPPQFVAIQAGRSARPVSCNSVHLAAAIDKSGVSKSERMTKNGWTENWGLFLRMLGQTSSAFLAKWIKHAKILAASSLPKSIEVQCKIFALRAPLKHNCIAKWKCPTHCRSPRNMDAISHQRNFLSSL